jgi:hypothetical protein
MTPVGHCRNSFVYFGRFLFSFIEHLALVLVTLSTVSVSFKPHQSLMFQAPAQIAAISLSEMNPFAPSVATVLSASDLNNPNQDQTPSSRA